MVNGLTRLATRFCRRCRGAGRAASRVAAPPSTRGEALALGLVTFAPDEIDWDDEIRLAIEERASLSPDALTGLEANLRFAGPETMETTHLRPALGLAELDLQPAERGRRAGRAEALRHAASKPKFNWERV